MIKNLLLTFLLSFFITISFAQIDVSDPTPVVENFNGMAATTALPANWRMGASTGSPVFSTSSTTVTQQASTGSPTAGGTYNWGENGATDRAIGAMTSNGFASPNNLMVNLRNAGSTNITSLTISYTGERYRINTAAASVQLYYSLNGSTWVPVAAGDILASEFTTGSSAYTFATPLKISRSNIPITGLSITQTSNFYLRWNINTTGSNSQGIGIDDISISATFEAGGCTPPTTQATLFNTSNATLTSMDVAWTRGNGTNVLVVARAGSAVNSGPVNGTTYTANSVFGSGTQIGTGNYVVYDGLSTAPGFNITGLTANTTYHYAIYEYNLTDHCYLSPALVGNASTLSPPAAMYRTIGSGGWNTPSVWETSTDNGMNWLPAVGFPTLADATITIRNGHAITMSENKSLDQLTIETGGSLEILSGQLTINDGLGAEDLIISGTLINSSSPTTTIAKGSGAVVSVHSGGLYQHNTLSNIYPLFTWQTGSTIEVKTMITGGFASSNLNQPFANFNWNVTGQTAEANFNGLLTTVTGNLTLTSTGASNVRLIGSTYTMQLGGNLVINSGAILNMSGTSSSATINLKGDLTINGLLTELGTGQGTISFSNASSQQTITVADPDLSIAEKINFEILNPNGVILLSNLSFNYDGNLILNTGTIRTNGFTLTVVAPAAVVGGSASSFICNCDATGNTLATGYLVADIAAGNTKIFPVGPTPALYMPATLTGNVGTVSDYYFLRVDPLGANGVVPTQSTQCIQYQWQIDVGSPASAHDINLKLQWAAGTEGSNFNPNNNLVIGHWNGVKFDVVNNANYNSGEPSATSTLPFTAFSPFVVASGFSPLPVNLLNFTAQKSGSNVKLLWNTANEIENKYFIVERSSDGISFNEIGKVNGKNIEKASYVFIDNNAVKGQNFYRLNQQDFNGANSYSNIAAVNFSNSITNVFPTIARDFVKIETDNASFNYELFDANGQIVIKNKAIGSKTIDISYLNAGIYFLKISGVENTTHKIIKY